MAEVNVPLPDSSLAWIGAHLPAYLKNCGYTVPVNFSSDFFLAASAMIQNGELDDFNSLAPVVSTLVADKPELSAKIEDDYRVFVAHRAMHMVYADSAEGRSIQAQREILSRKIDAVNQKLWQSEAQASKLEKRIETRLAQQQKDANVPKDQLTFSSIAVNKLAKDISALDATDLNLVFSDENDSFLSEITSRQKFTESQLDDMISELKTAFNNIPKMKNKAAAVTFLSDALNAVKSAEAVEKHRSSLSDKLENDRKLLQSARSEQKAAQDKLNGLNAQLKASESVLLVKSTPSMIHRQKFIKRNNRSVQSACKAPGETLHKDFEKLNASDKEVIRQYIRDNAQKFRTRLSRNIRTRNHHRLNMEDTCRLACGTGGTPVRLQYEKQKPGKARIVMLLDISGSCRKASEIMLDLMYEIKDVFPNGCRPYVFVNSLNDVSDLLDAVDPASATTDVLNTIPTKGVYSDYETTMRHQAEQNITMRTAALHGLGIKPQILPFTHSGH